MPLSLPSLLAGAGAVLIAASAGPVNAGLKADIAACRSQTEPEQAAEAVQVCSRALNTPALSDPVRAGLLVARGEARFVIADYEAAIADFGEALTLDPTNHLAWLGRGKSRIETGDYGEAIENLDQALKLQGSDDRALYWRGEALMRAGDAEEALRFYTQALVARRNAPTYLYARARANNRLANTAAAIADYEAAVRGGGADLTRDLQTHLQSHGHYTGAIDGQYGPGTARALRACIADPDC